MPRIPTMFPPAPQPTMANTSATDVAATTRRGNLCICNMIHPGYPLGV